MQIEATLISWAKMYNLSNAFPNKFGIIFLKLIQKNELSVFAFELEM
jgi:hypothetical protein